jgi:glycosyltransferase involved in cell wall biosynthesis
LAAQKEGLDVTMVCKDTGRRNEVEALGLKMLELPINPTGMNLGQEFKTLWFLYTLYKNNKDAVIHHVGLKNILWGALAAKLAGVRGVVNAVSGLGAIFSKGKIGLMAKSVLYIMRFSNRRKNVKVIFQNNEDRALFLKYGVVEESQAEFIKGSGVNLNEFKYVPEPESETLKVVFSARMVKEKGVIEMIEAAEKLRNDYEGRVEFWLCGRLAVNADAVSREELESRCDGKYIKWLGYRTDVKELLQQSHIVAFPSYYMEGLPKSLIEACAIGRPIITTQSIGCKDTVDDGVNGYLVAPKEVEPLVQKLRLLIDDAALRQKMGKASREKAERDFSLDVVIERHLNIYNELIKK